MSELVRFRFSENAKWFFFSFLWSDSYKIHYSFNFSWNEFTSPWQLLLVRLNNTLASIYCGSSSVSINSLSDFLIFVCLIWICVFYWTLRNFSILRKLVSECSIPILSENVWKHPCRSAISIKLHSDFIEITLWHGCFLTFSESIEMEHWSWMKHWYYAISRRSGQSTFWAQYADASWLLAIEYSLLAMIFNQKSCKKIKENREKKVPNFYTVMFNLFH